MINVTHENSYWFLIAYVVAVYLVDWIWSRYVDWYLAREVVRRRLFGELGDAKLGNLERRSED